MAQETRQTAADQLRYLLDRIKTFSFYQAVDWLHRLWPDAPSVGQEGPVEEERVRLRPTTSLSFPDADLEDAEVIDDGRRVLITTTFFGIYGADTPLPYAYAEHIAQIASEERGKRVRGFLDIFHHRLLSLLFRSWEKYRPSADPDRELDPLYGRVLSFMGFSQELGLGGGSLPRLSEVRLQVLRHRSAEGLRFLLQKRLGYRVDVQQLVRREVAIPESQRSRMGRSNCVMGASLVVGKRITDCNKIRVQVEAEDFEMFNRLLPGRDDFEKIESALGGYMRSPVDHDVEVKLAADKIPKFQLGADTIRLGQSIWLGVPSEGVACLWQPEEYR